MKMAAIIYISTIAAMWTVYIILIAEITHSLKKNYIEDQEEAGYRMISCLIYALSMLLAIIWLIDLIALAVTILAENRRKEECYQIVDMMKEENIQEGKLETKLVRNMQ